MGIRATTPAPLRSRRYPRLAVDVEGTLVGRVAHPVRLVDLSLVGCLVRCDALMEPGAILDLQLPLAQESFTAKVRVIDSSLDGVVDSPLDGSAAAGPALRALAGLDFVSLSARDESRLRRFLQDERRRRRSADAPSQ
jgi:hypothetical protein